MGLSRPVRITLWTLGAVAVVALLIALNPRPLVRLVIRALSSDYAAPEVEGDPTAAAFVGADAQREHLEVALTRVAEGFKQPTHIEFVPGSARSALVLERGGTGQWLSVSDGRHGQLLALEVLTASEQGLLGAAFHPDFLQNGRFFLNYVTAHEGEHMSHVAEWRLDRPADLEHASAAPVRVLLRVEQPYQNHNGGHLAFGPDGYLYIGFGDGGLADDPLAQGQAPDTFLGSMLRIDVDTPGQGRAYGIPQDNPFVGKPGFAPEVFAYGLRNPWRYSFDPSGRLVVADVGQNRWEEVSLVQAGDNLGWNIKEGRECFGQPPQGCQERGLVDPIYVYGRDEGTSITGGHVYLGRSLLALHGRYVFGDFVSGRLWALKLPQDRGQGATASALGRFALLPSSFGRDAQGEVYLTAYGRGHIYRLSPKGSAGPEL